MPVMTFGYLPQPYSGLASAANSLYPVETTTAPTVISLTCSRWSIRIAEAGQALTHSWHSEQTPQSRQLPAPDLASASVSGASISSKSRRSGRRSTCPLTRLRWP
jgi:hypothetical protein